MVPWSWCSMFHNVSESEMYATPAGRAAIRRADSPGAVGEEREKPGMTRTRFGFWRRRDAADPLCIDFYNAVGNKTEMSAIERAERRRQAAPITKPASQGQAPDYVFGL